MATELEDEKDPKRARVVLSKGHEVVGPGYLTLIGAAAKVTDRGENSGNPSRVNWVSKTELHYLSRVSRVGRVSWVSRVMENLANTESRVTENLTNMENRVTQNLANTESRATQNSANTESRVTKKSANMDIGL
jgi:hypothetical protein